MADSKLSALTSQPTADPADVLPIVDVSDTTQAASGSTKKITAADLMKVQPTGTRNVYMGSSGSPNATGEQNTTLGSTAGAALTGGNHNTLIGAKAGESIAGSGDPDLVGALNTCIGADCCAKTTTGYANTAIGQKAMLENVTGDRNVAIGKSAMQAGTANDRVIAIGAGVLDQVTTTIVDSVYIGGNSTAAGSKNVCVSGRSGTGIEMVAIGFEAGSASATGNYNVFVGASSGSGVTSGSHNVLIGYRTGVSATTSKGVVAVGTYAGETSLGSRNIILGTNARVPSGATNIFVAGSTFDFGGGTQRCNISDVYFGGGVTSSTPYSYTINGTGGNGTDSAGSDISIAGGKGTGSGAGGSVKLQTAAAGSTGSTANTLTTHVEINSAGLVLLPTLPTSDPAVAGALWNDTGTLKVSAG